MAGPAANRTCSTGRKQRASMAGERIAAAKSSRSCGIYPLRLRAPVEANMAVDTFVKALDEFTEARRKLAEAADVLYRLADQLRAHPMRVEATDRDVILANELPALLARFEEAKENARAAYAAVPVRLRDNLEPPP